MENGNDLAKEICKPEVAQSAIEMLGNSIERELGILSDSINGISSQLTPVRSPQPVTEEPPATAVSASPLATRIDGWCATITRFRRNIDEIRSELEI